NSLQKVDFEVPPPPFPLWGLSCQAGVLVIDRAGGGRRGGCGLRDVWSDRYARVGYRRTIVRRESPLSKLERGLVGCSWEGSRVLSRACRVPPAACSIDYSLSGRVVMAQQNPASCRAIATATTVLRLWRCRRRRCQTR